LSQYIPITDTLPESGPAAATTPPQAAERADAVGERIRSHQAQFLSDRVLSGAANLPAVIITSFAIRSSVPLSWIELWIAVTAAIVAGLGISVRGLPWRRGDGGPERSPRRRLATHCLFATMLGAVWGGACLAFGPRLTHDQMMLLTVIVLACNAACVSALGAYLPAFFGYCIASFLPLAYVNFLRPEHESGEFTLLILLYMLTTWFNSTSHSKHFLAALTLRAENELLADNVSRADAALVAATRSKWDTLAHLSHELRTPMTAIIGFSELMRDQLFGPLSERYHAYTHHIYDSGRHALDLIDAILEVSRAEAGQLSLSASEIVPSTLVEECLRMVEHGASLKHQTLDSRIVQPMPLLMADQMMLRQALLNLLSNAIKYTPEGGRVGVALQMADGGLDIKVSDTGVGIAAGDLERCLEPFVRLDNPHTAGVEGAGLGLPLAKHLVELHGGSLAIASTPGRGTCVTVHLPPELCRAA